MTDNNKEALKTEKVDMSKAFTPTDGKGLDRGSFTDVINGVADVKTQTEVIDEIRRTTKDEKTKEMLSETQQDGNTKAKRREFLYFVQDMYTQKALLMQKQVADAKPAERDRLLYEIKEMGRFCGELEKELRWLRST